MRNALRKKSVLVSIATVLLLFTNYLMGEVVRHLDKSNYISNALKNGKFSANLNFFYMVRTFDNVKPDTKAFTGGGIIKYESQDYHRVKIGFAYYGSHRISGLYSRKEGIRTSLLQGNGDDIAFLGEAYLSYNLEKTIFKIGRQRLDTPLMGDLYLRVAPTTYEAAIVRNRDVPKTMIEAGYTQSYSGFGSRYSSFNNKDNLWGKDGLVYIYLKNNSMENLSIRGQYIYSLSIKNDNGITIARRDYKYADLKYNLPIGNESYFKVQYGGNDYNNAPNSTLLTFSLSKKTAIFKNKSLLF